MVAESLKTQNNFYGQGRLCNKGKTVKVNYFILHMQETEKVLATYAEVQFYTGQPGYALNISDSSNSALALQLAHV